MGKLGYCFCGCGNKTNIYQGVPRKFLPHHHIKTKEFSDNMKGNERFKGKKHSSKTKEKMKKRQTGKNNSNWNGGRTKAGGGYICILKKLHPLADVNGRVKEERLIMEKHLGRYLIKTEIVHHKNRLKDDNRLKNLQLLSSMKEHRKIHAHDGKTIYWEDGKCYQK